MTLPYYYSYHLTVLCRVPLSNKNSSSKDLFASVFSDFQSSMTGQFNKLLNPSKTGLLQLQVQKVQNMKRTLEVQSAKRCINKNALFALNLDET